MLHFFQKYGQRHWWFQKIVVITSQTVTISSRSIHFSYPRTGNSYTKYLIKKKERDRKISRKVYIEIKISSAQLYQRGRYQSHHRQLLKNAYNLPLAPEDWYNCKERLWYYTQGVLEKKNTEKIAPGATKKKNSRRKIPRRKKAPEKNKTRSKSFKFLKKCW